MADGIDPHVREMVGALWRCRKEMMDDIAIFPEFAPGIRNCAARLTACLGEHASAWKTREEALEEEIRGLRADIENLTEQLKAREG